MYIMLVSPHVDYMDPSPICVLGSMSCFSFFFLYPSDLYVLDF